MDLSLFYFVFFLFTLLSIADPTESDIPCPTSRRLLLFGGINLPSGGKKSHQSSSSSKSLPSSPPKYARSSDSHGLTVYIQPQTSNELGHKVRSYTHLLKSKLYTNEEKAQLKRLRTEKKKQSKTKNSLQTPKTQELVAINDDELNRCKALLQVDSPTKDNKKSKKEKSIKQEISSKVKNVTNQAAKNIKNKVTATTTASPPVNDKKVKASKGNVKTNTDEKKTTKLSPPSAAKTNENRPYTSPVTNIPVKSPPPSPASQSTINTKSKRTKPETITIIQQTTLPFLAGEDEIDDTNNSVVRRAFHFVKNMFQLSDDILDENQSEEDQIIDLINEQPPQQHHHHHSRKLLSIDENNTIPIVTNELEEIDLYLNNNQHDDSSYVLASISKRQLLSVKANKQLTSSKDKKQKALTKTDANKPKVGWAYRYRISRYLAAQKMKRSGNKNKQTGGGKTKQTTLSTNTKIPKRKLLEYHTDDDDDSSTEISDQNIINTVSITDNFVPKRHLLISKSKTNYDEDTVEQKNTRRRKKSFEELTDPIAIVQSYDRGSYKPRVGWQFRYRVSRYIDSLRENIREDQERLKLGLHAIKRKTPQELSGRRKHILNKPFATDSEQLKKQEKNKTNEQESKPNVGWRYRYRISKMVEAEKHGDHIDKEAEKRQARIQPKKKSSSHNKSRINVDDEPIEGEKDLDPELQKINDEGRRVGWAYRYRIRQKLDYLKQQQAETGIPFDLATLSGKRDKKPLEPKIKSTEKKITEPIEEKPQDKTKSVGWKYRYRVSKMREAQKRNKSKISTSKKHEQSDPKLAPLQSDEQHAGWEYRYRIQRKLDSQKNAVARDNGSGKHAKKSSSVKRKGKEKIIKKVKEVLNIDDIDETPVMEYFRRASSYIFFGLLPTAKKSLCLLPLPVTFSFCDDQRSTKTEQPKQIPIKKLKTKKEQRAKQFIRSHTTKFGADDKATERRVDETMKNLYKKPSLPPLQTPPLLPKKQRVHSSKESKTNEHGEKESIKKVVGVESMKNENKKQFQIIGQQVKIKQKHLSPPSTMTTPPPIVELPITTASPRLRTISEVIREQAATILAPRQTSSRTPEEIQQEIDETNEIIQEQKKLKAAAATTTTSTPPTLIDSTTSGKDDNGSPSSTTNDSEINQENVHNMLDLEKEKNSS